MGAIIKCSVSRAGSQTIKARVYLYDCSKLRIHVPINSLIFIFKWSPWASAELLCDTNPTESRFQSSKYCTAILKELFFFIGGVSAIVLFIWWHIKGPSLYLHMYVCIQNPHISWLYPKIKCLMISQSWFAGEF